MAQQADIFANPLNQARELKRRRQYPEAEALLRRALTERPEDNKFRASLADLYYRSGRQKDALKLAGEILRSDPRDPRALVVLGNVLYEKRKYLEALEYFQLAIEIAPTDYLWARAAHCHIKLKRPGPALDALDQGAALAPASPKLLRLRAQTARLLNNAAMEQAVFDQAARLAPQEAQDYFAFLYPLLADLPPRRAVMFSARARERAGQEGNPHLLLFEAEGLADSRDPGAARQRLTSLLQRPTSQAIEEAARDLLARLDSKEDAP